MESHCCDTLCLLLSVWEKADPIFTITDYIGDWPLPAVTDLRHSIERHWRLALVHTATVTHSLWRKTDYDDSPLLWPLSLTSLTFPTTIDFYTGIVVTFDIYFTPPFLHFDSQYSRPIIIPFVVHLIHCDIDYSPFMVTDPFIIPFTHYSLLFDIIVGSWWQWGHSSHWVLLTFDWDDDCPYIDICHCPLTCPRCIPDIIVCVWPFCVWLCDNHLTLCYIQWHYIVTWPLTYSMTLKNLTDGIHSIWHWQENLSHSSFEIHSFYWRLLGILLVHCDIQPLIFSIPFRYSLLLLYWLIVTIPAVSDTVRGATFDWPFGDTLTLLLFHCWLEFPVVFEVTLLSFGDGRAIPRSLSTVKIFPIG